MNYPEDMDEYTEPSFDSQNSQGISNACPLVDLDDLRQGLRNLEHAVITNRLYLIRLYTERVAYCVRTILRATEGFLQHASSSVVRQRFVKLTQQRQRVRGILETLITQSQNVLSGDILEDEQEAETVHLLGSSEQLSSLVQELMFTADEYIDVVDMTDVRPKSSVEYDVLASNSILDNVHTFAYLKPSSQPLPSRHDIEYSEDGTLLRGTICALVEEMTPHDTLVDQAFSAAFFLTFRLFSSPLELLENAILRWNLKQPTNLSKERLHMWQHRKWIPVRLRVLNLIKTWIMYHWESSDDSVLPLLESFLKETADFLEKSKTISLDLLQIISQRLRSPGNIAVKRARGLSESRIDPNILLSITPPPRRPSLNQAPPFPASIITKSLLTALERKEFGTIFITAFEPLELARQLTLMESALYCALLPSEILGADQAGDMAAKSVTAVMSFNTNITKWVSQSIAREAENKKTKRLFKFFIQLANCCIELNNFSTCRSIMAALKPNDTIWSIWSQLLRSGLTPKQREQVDNLNFLADPDRYHNRLNATTPPAIPILGRHMYDVICCQRDVPSHIISTYNPTMRLINFSKYREIAKIVQNLLMFQVPYSLKPIPEVQEYLTYCFSNVTDALPDEPHHEPLLSNTEDPTIANEPNNLKAESKSDLEDMSIINSILADSLYSVPSSRTVSTDYGLFYTRHACSQDSFGSQWWAESSDHIPPPINV